MPGEKGQKSLGIVTVARVEAVEDGREESGSLKTASLSCLKVWERAGLSLSQSLQTLPT